MPAIPSDLSGDELRLYQAVVAEHPEVQAAHAPALRVYCQTVQLLKLTQEQLQFELHCDAERCAASCGDAASASPPAVSAPLRTAVSDLQRIVALLAQELGLVPPSFALADDEAVAASAREPSSVDAT